MTQHKNTNRGCQKLIVWQDAAELYILTCKIFRKFQHELRRVAANQIATADPVHRDIAEGYCRRSINEYLQLRNIALGSRGDSVSAVHMYRRAAQLSEAEFGSLDALPYKLEKGMKKLIESLQYKREQGGWEDSFVLKESNFAYRSSERDRAS